MPSLIASVDRLSGNYEDVFIYSINVGFSGIVGEINSAKIEVVFPSFLNIFLGDTNDPIKNVSQNIIDGDTKVVYDFGSITDLGIATRIGIGVTYKTDTESLTKFTFNPKLLINGEEVISFLSDEIELIVTPRFVMSREIVLPLVEPSPNSEIYYKVTLENYGDLGGFINNANVSCFGSDDITIDTTFEVVGQDVSSKFADSSMDNVLGVFEGNTVLINLPRYSGQKYEFIYKAIISNNALIGEQLVTNATLNADDTEEQIEFHDLTLNEEIYDADISIYAPDYTLPQEYICYRMNIRNTGNQVLRTAVFKNELPDNIRFYKFNTGAFHIGALNQNLNAQYTIDFDTVNGNSGTFGIFNSNNNTSIDLSEFIDTNDRLSAIYWNLQILSVGVKDRVAPSLFGIVDEDVEISSDIFNHIHLNYSDVNEEEFETIQNATTIVDNICVLRPSLSSSVGTAPVRPNQVFRYTMSVNCVNSRLLKPIVATVLPKELEYVGNETFTFSDVFTSISPTLPQAQVLTDFNEFGDTLIKYQFDGEYEFLFRQLARFNISFDVKVAVGAYGDIQSFMILNTVDSTGQIPNNFDVYTDVNNIAQNIEVEEKYSKTDEIENTVLFFVSTSSDKKVKGALDTQFIEEPLVGSTYEAGTLEYKITVKNIGNSDLTKVEIIDILPYVGDTSIISPNVDRGSQFNVYALSEVSAKLLSDNKNVNFDIEYSTSKDPVRFGANFDMIGTIDNWTQNLPDEVSKLSAFKVSTKDIVLKPNDVLEVQVLASVPVGVNREEVAWNTFSADVTYIDINGIEQHLLAIEPEKVGISIKDTPADTVEIGGYVWLDEEYDGKYTNGERAINDVGVMLLDENMYVKAITFTAPNANGVDGKYLFKNLVKGKYYIRFFIDDINYKFIKQDRSVKYSSLANIKTGITPIIDMTQYSSNTEIIAGVILKSKRTIDEILGVNNSVQSVMRNVIKNQMLLVMKGENIIELL